MDRTFRGMLEGAERIRTACRRTDDTGAHAEQMMKMIQYAQKHHLFTGSVPTGTANEENLAQAAEMAAFIIEVIHGGQVGSVLGLPREWLLAICREANEKAEAHIAAVVRGSEREK